MKVRIEVRPGEGGNDARLLVGEQATIYERYAQRCGIHCARKERPAAAVG